MAFHPRYSREDVERLIAAGDLGPMEIYRLEHQHPLNQLTHVFGMPLIAVSFFYPLYAYFAWDLIAWKECVGLGGMGWALQFLGHWIEGNKPAFYADPRQFVMGPLFFLGKPLFWLYPRVTGRSFWKVDQAQPDV
jgi:uncharacterized membrane protein YGL010W